MTGRVRFVFLHSNATSKVVFETTIFTIVGQDNEFIDYVLNRRLIQLLGKAEQRNLGEQRQEIIKPCMEIFN